MYARTFRKCTPVQDAAGDGVAWRQAGRKGLPPSAQEGRIWSFRPPASNAVRGMSGVSGFAGRKCPEFVGKRYTFPVGTGRMATWMEMAVSAEDLSSAVFEKSLITRRM